MPPIPASSPSPFVKREPEVMASLRAQISDRYNEFSALEIDQEEKWKKLEEDLKGVPKKKDAKERAEEIVEEIVKRFILTWAIKDDISFLTTELRDHVEGLRNGRQEQLRGLLRRTDDLMSEIKRYRRYINAIIEPKVEGPRKEMPEGYYRRRTDSFADQDPMYVRYKRVVDFRGTWWRGCKTFDLEEWRDLNDPTKERDAFEGSVPYV